jgi:hypothetical protein
MTHTSTIFVQVKDCIVDNTLTGAPAAMSKKFKKGDVVFEIDGVQATKQNIIELVLILSLSSSLCSHWHAE